MALTTLTQQTQRIQQQTTRLWPGTGAVVLATQLAERLPNALHHLTRNTPDGWSTQTSRPGRRHGISDPTPGYVIQRETATFQHRRLSGQLNTIEQHLRQRQRVSVTIHLRQALIKIDSWGPPLDPSMKPGLMCATIHPDDTGIEPWVDPLCFRVADIGRAGLCEACYRRRLRQRNG